MARGRGAAAIAKRSVTISGHATSVSLEEPFWTSLARIARAEGISTAALLRRIDASRPERDASPSNLSSAIRVFVLRWMAAKAGF
ncbi:MAG: ribbon-helix-helix domain-containing protein [Hyphomicrobiales bacterium]|nr:ribbon-helix-helix domain-containing protein [Hyphomicrobiales bacterium]